MEQIRIHGRGGQGSVTMAQMLADAAFVDGKWSQGFPSFGVERLGAPVQAFTRIDDEKITDRSQIDNPDYVIVQDPTLIELVEVAKGLKDDGMIIINSSDSSDEISLETKGEIITVDATNIALEHLGKPIMNTALMGAFASASGLIEKESLEKGIKKSFSGEIGEKNVDTMEAAFDEVS